MTRNTEREINYDDVGTVETYVKEASPELSEALDQALELQPISIRLQKGLLDDLKALAHLNGIGYQPLIRQVLTRWARCEIKQILREKAQRIEVSEADQDEPAADRPLEKAA